MSEDAQFAGRVVAVWVRDPAQGAVLEEITIKTLGTRSFLVGRMADDGKGSDPRTGMTFWFPVDDVLMLTVFPDVQSARTAYAARDAAQDAKGGSKSSWWQWQR